MPAAFRVWSVDLCLAKGTGNDDGGGGGESLSMGTVIFTTCRLVNTMGLNRSTPQRGRGRKVQMATHRQHEVHARSYRRFFM